MSFEGRGGGDRAEFEMDLREAARNVYVVNQKRPPYYDRQWKLHVLWNDGTTSTYWGDDSPAGFERIHRQALRDPRAAVT